MITDAEVAQLNETMSQAERRAICPTAVLTAILAASSTVLITGATGGIGAALARSYAQPGRTLAPAWPRRGTTCISDPRV